MDDYVVVAGPSSPALGEELSQLLNLPLIQTKSDVFPDGESRVRVMKQVKDRCCILVQSMYPPVDRHLFQCLLLARNLSLNGCRIHGIFPYIAYARQDRVFVEGELVSVELVAYLLKVAGILSITTIDIHSQTAAERFSIPLTNLTAVKVMADFLISKEDLSRPLIVSPDFGGSMRADAFAQAMGAETFAFKKQRDRSTGEVEIEKTNVPVKDRDAVVVDDMISTGGSVVKAAEVLREAGARRIFVMCTHPLLIGNALEKILNAGVQKVFGTDSIPSSVSKVSIAPLIAQHLRTRINMS